MESANFIDFICLWANIYLSGAATNVVICVDQTVRDWKTSYSSMCKHSGCLHWFSLSMEKRPTDLCVPRSNRLSLVRFCHPARCWSDSLSMSTGAPRSLTPRTVANFATRIHTVPYQLGIISKIVTDRNWFNIIYWAVRFNWVYCQLPGQTFSRLVFWWVSPPGAIHLWNGNFIGAWNKQSRWLLFVAAVCSTDDRGHVC